MVDKRSLRSSKKDNQETPAEDEKSSKQPARKASTRSRKTKTQPETPSTTESPAPTGNPSDEIIVESTNALPDPGRSNEDIEMKTGEEDAKEEKVEKPETVEDPKVAVIQGMPFMGKRGELMISD